MPPEDTAASLDEQLREACAALDRRVRAGETVRTEDVLAERPDLAERTECVLELAYTEFVARDALGEACAAEEWYARFPAWAGDLRELFEVHRYVQQAALDTASPHSDATEDGEAPANLAAMFQEESSSDRRLGNYELIEELGRGGMGVVYKARQIGVRRVVALKLILAGEHAGKDRCARFEAEAEIVGRLAHPNIVQIYEVGNDQGRPYLSLEFVDGGSLDRKLNGTPMPPRDAASLLTVICQAIHHAHKRGVIHRDLKPANILLTADGTPKVADFGLAKRLFDDQSGQTASGAMLGTPSYMAPEQALGDSRDSGAASDIYALGAILYEMLSGRPPFRGATLLDTLEQVRSQEPVPPRQLVGKLPRDLDTICLKCLQKQPAHRYASAAALLDDVQRFLDYQPILARPVGWVGRAVRWSRRNPVLASLSAALAAVLTAILIVAPIVAVTQAALRSEIQKQLNEVTRQNRAKSASLLATRSRLSANEAPQRSVLLAIEAMESHRAVGETPPVTIEQALRDALANTGGVPLVGHASQIFATRFTPDSRMLITTSADATARLWQLGHPQEKIESVVLQGHRAPIRGLAVSRDGRRLVTYAADNTAGLWDLNAPHPSETAYEIAGFAAPLTSAAFSPDGTRLALSDHGGSGRLFRITEGTAPELIQKVQLKLPLHDAQFSASGKWLAAGGGDKAARVWPVSEAGLGELRLLSGHAGPLVAIAMDPQRDRLATASADRTLRLWDLDASSPEATVIALPGHTNSVSAAAFTPDGRWLVSSSFDGTVRRWDLNAPDIAASARPLTGHTDRVFVLAVSPDSRWLATGGRDKTVRLWDLTANEPSATSRVLRGHDDAVQALTFSADAKWLASGSADSTARLWEMSLRTPTAGSNADLTHDGEKVEQLAISASGRWLASFANDGYVRLWDRESRKERARLLHSAAVRFIAFSGDEHWLATVELDIAPRAPRVWDLTASDPAATPIVLEGATQSIESLVIDPQGKWIAAGSRYNVDAEDRDGAVRVWELGGVAPAARIIASHQADVGYLAIDAGTNRIISASADGQVQLSDLQPGEPSAAKSFQTDDLRGLALLRDGEFVATLHSSGNARVLDLKAPSGQQQSILYQGKLPLNRLAASEDGNWLVAVDALDQVLLWDMSSWPGRDVAPPQPRVLGDDETSGRGVTGCAISRDGARLATFGLDGLIRLWNLREWNAGGTPLLLSGHVQHVQSAVFTPDGRTLISGGYYGGIREWPLTSEDLLSHARRVVGRELTPDERRRYME
ncbi:MAG: protein kinase [Planctomycetia bacterium]|nr:protein kinase [Planctomycetia bacterium]